MNCFMNAENIHNFWQGLGHFLVGAGVGAATSAASQWASNATLAVGIIPGATIGGLTGAATGAAGGFLMNGLNNLIQGQGFTDNAGRSVGSGALNGFINGLISGGIEGYNRAKIMQANLWTGQKVIKTYNFPVNGYRLKQGVPNQSDPTAYCYANALEYADSGHQNHKEAYFIEKAHGERSADPAVVAAESFPDAQVGRVINPNGTEWFQTGNRLNGGMTELIGVIRSGDLDHAVNVLGIEMVEKIKVFGGGTKLMLNNTIIRDPINGLVRSGIRSYKTLTWIRY